MKGESRGWKDETMADTFTRAVAFIKRHKADHFSSASRPDICPHKSTAPSIRRQSGMGPRGDAIVEFDWSVGES